jgi:Gpi18-like mannosyltransferase
MRDAARPADRVGRLTACASGVRGFLSEYRVPIGVFLLSLTLYLAGRQYVFSSHKPDYTPWDSVWYADIVKNGYSTNHDYTFQHNVAFFPLYPGLVWCVRRLSGMPSVHSVMLVCSSLLTFWTMILMYRFVRDRHGAPAAGMSVALFGLNPFALYLYNG